MRLMVGWLVLSIAVSGCVESSSLEVSVHNGTGETIDGTFRLTHEEGHDVLDEEFTVPANSTAALANITIRDVGIYAATVTFDGHVAQEEFLLGTSAAEALRLDWTAEGATWTLQVV